MQIGAATMENSMEVPQNTKNRTAIWSSNPTPGHVSGQNYNLKRYIHPYVHCSTTYSQDMETTYTSMNGKGDVVHTYNGMLRLLLSHFRRVRLCATP